MSQNAVAATALMPFCVVHVVFAGLRTAPAAGAPLGRFAWGGNHRILPTNLRVGSLVTIFFYVIFVFIALERAGASAVLPSLVARVAIWVLAAYFSVGLILNSVSRSRAERLTMVPACLLLVASSVLLGLS